MKIKTREHPNNPGTEMGKELAWSLHAWKIPYASAGDKTCKIGIPATEKEKQEWSWTRLEFRQLRVSASEVQIELKMLCQSEVIMSKKKLFLLEQKYWISTKLPQHLMSLPLFQPAVSAVLLTCFQLKIGLVWLYSGASANHYWSVNVSWLILVCFYWSWDKVQQSSGSNFAIR